MTTYRNGQPRPPSKPTRVAAASGFALWTWAASGATTGRVVPPYTPPFHELPTTWATKTPEQVMADVAAAIQAVVDAPPETLTAEQYEAMSPGQRVAAWRHFHGA